MLALTRKVKERIKITAASGEIIVITVGEIKSKGQVRLLFEADRKIVIDRMEVDEAKAR